MRSAVVAWTLATETLDPRRTTALEALLDPGERARAARFAFAADRRDFVAAHGLVKEKLAGWLGLAPSQLRMSADAPGAKPRLSGPGCGGLDVNITHCRGLVACVGAFGCSVGIDAESLDAGIFDGETGPSLAEELLSREERRWLLCLPPQRAGADFLHLWTLKEALAKAEGGGLGLGLRRCVVLPDPPRLLSLPQRMGAVSEWTLRQWTPTSRHVVAIACRIPAGEARLLDIVDLDSAGADAHRAEIIGEPCRRGDHDRI
jgi:4'-phosphopantetheinyl transferase